MFAGVCHLRSKAGKSELKAQSHKSILRAPLKHQKCSKGRPTRKKKTEKKKTKKEEEEQGKEEEEEEKEEEKEIEKEEE